MRTGTRSAMVVGLLALAAGMARADVQFTKVWETDSDSSMANPRTMGYDPVTDTLVAPDSATPYDVHAFDASTGAAKANLSTTGLTTGSLGWFALAGSASGKIYGYNSQTGGLTIWQSPTDPAPTEVTWSGGFSRNLDVVGSTIYAVGSGNGGPITINDPAPSPGTGYVLTAGVGGSYDPNLAPGGKAGVTANAAGTLLFGSETVSGPPNDGIHMWTKGSSGWAYQGDLLFPVQYPSAGILHAMDVAYDEPHHILFGIERSYDTIFAIDVGDPMKYGDEIFAGKYQIPTDTTYYGSIQVDPSKQKVYWLGRNTDGSTSYGSLSYAIRAAGDANGDGKINGDDYNLLDRGYAKYTAGTLTSPTWTDGDFNLDGVIDSADYLILDTAYGKATGQLSEALLSERESQFGAAYVSALTAAVPEPALLGAMALPLVLAMRRRRR